MGENEQGGMLRTVVVIGLVAIIAIVMIVGVVGLKSSLRTNTLMASTMGQNILKIDQSDSDKMFHRLGGYETLSYDDSTDTYTLILSTKSQYDDASWGYHGGQGMYYGPGSTYSPKDYNAFLPGDKYYMTADIRTTSDVSLMSKVSHEMSFQSSKTEMSVNPDITNSWQHYETKGVRLDTWGAPLVTFTNNNDQAVTIQIKNIKLFRQA